MRISYKDYAYILNLKYRHIFLKLFCKATLEKNDYQYILKVNRKIILFPFGIIIEFVNCIWNDGLKYFSPLSGYNSPIIKYPFFPEEPMWYKADEVYNRKNTLS